MASTSICNQYLTLLGVPHTACFADKIFNTHPYSGTLKGFQSLLDLYNVSSEIRRYADKSSVFTERGPFLAMILGKLEIVTAIDDDSVTIVKDSKPEKMAKADFLKQWNGKALFATPGCESCEPEFRKHKQIRGVALARRWGIPLCGIILFVLFYITNGLYHSIGATLVAIFDIVGIYACYQLLRDQLHVSSAAGDAICGFLAEKGCEKIMARDVSKIFGVIGWGEVGMAYFAVSLVALLLYPASIGYLALFNACCLPYTVWSIAYQKFVAKTWCTLCVAVQTLQWLLFGSYLLADAWHGLWPLHSSFFILGFSYLGALLIIDKLLSVIAPALDNKTTSVKFDNLRLRSDVLEIEQKDEPEIASLSDGAALIFGNADGAPQAVIFCDPTSPQALELHREIDTILKKGLSAAYIFATDKPENEALARKIISHYQAKGAGATWGALSRLFASGGVDTSMFDLNVLNPQAAEVSDAIAKMRKWQEDSYIYAAPTIAVNGRLLPSLYSLHDLVYIY